MTLTLHLVPHTHWDREWYLTFQQFRIRLVHLMDRLLETLAADPAFAHFMLDGQTIILQDYLEIRPERTEDIARLVRAGRLSIGPWHVLPDEYLVAPESLVRNLMLGDRICRRFGAKMHVGYVPDPFGHIGQLPQILQGFDIDAAAFRRGLDDEPAELWWRAPDGERVLVCYLRDGYDNAARLPTTDPEAFSAAIRAARDSLAPHANSGHLLLLAGTDHHEAQPEIPTLIARANGERLNGDWLVHGSLQAYVASVRQAVETQNLDLETVAGELRSPKRHHLLPAVLSARMWIKQRNETVETLLTRWVEPFAAWAELLDEQDNSEKLRRHIHLTGHEPLTRVRQPGPLIWHAWRLLLENHPHDSICGCSVDQVHREMVPRFDQAEQIGEEIVVQSLNAIADRVDTHHCVAQDESQSGVHPLIVFNPTGGPRTDVVAARLRLPGAPETLEVVSLDGRVLPHQVVAGPAGEERPFFQIEVTPEEIMAYSGLVQGGRLLNHVIHQVQLRRAGDEVDIQIILGKNGAPDHAHITSVRSEIEALVATGQIARFNVRTVVAEPSDLIFVAPDIPSHGYATFTVRLAQSPAPAGPRAPVVGKTEEALGTPALETDLFIVQVNPSDGSLALTDKTSGAIYTGLNRFVDGGDRGDEYNYCQPEEDQIIAWPVAPPTVRVIERGPARQILEIAQSYRLPGALRPDRHGRGTQTVGVSIISRISLYPGVRRVDVETTIDNLAQDHRLRVHFPVPVRVEHAHTEGHFCVVRRPVLQTSDVSETSEVLDTSDWIEQPVPTAPQRGWADVSDGQIGLMVANRGLPEVEFIPDGDHTTIALTLLRCVGWLSRDDLHCRQGHAGPELPTPEAQCPGRHTFHYALIPHTGDWKSARAQAEAFRAPLRALAAEIQPGVLPPAVSLVQVDPPSFALSAIKLPEEAKTPGLIVRGVNLSDKPADVHLRPWRPFEGAARTNLNEEPRESLSPDEDGAVTLAARPWEIVTVKWND